MTISIVGTEKVRWNGPGVAMAVVLAVVVIALVVGVLVYQHASSGASPSYTDGYTMAQNMMSGETSIEAGPAAACDLWASHGVVPSGDIGSQWIQGCTAFMSAHGSFLSGSMG